MCIIIITLFTAAAYYTARENESENAARKTISSNDWNTNKCYGVAANDIHMREHKHRSVTDHSTKWTDDWMGEFNKQNEQTEFTTKYIQLEWCFENKLEVKCDGIEFSCHVMAAQKIFFSYLFMFTPRCLFCLSKHWMNRTDDDVDKLWIADEFKTGEHRQPTSSSSREIAKFIIYY